GDLEYPRGAPTRRSERSSLPELIGTRPSASGEEAFSCPGVHRHLNRIEGYAYPVRSSARANIEVLRQRMNSSRLYMRWSWR
ncbi:jg26029, partial [Pararge aegeria aegeria]